jgi:hypothetical protein
MREKGTSRKKSAQFAKNLTVNFNKHGTWGPTMNKLWVFSNAGIQGSFRLLSGAIKHKKTRKILAGLTATAFLNAVLHRMLDPDDWDEMDAYKKDNMVLIGVPGTNKMGSVKVGYGINVFWASGVILEDLMAGQEWYQELLGIPKGSGTDTGGAFWRFVGAIDQGFNPLGSGSLGQMITPTIATPIVQWAENKNYFGSPIYKTAFPGQAPPPDYTMHWKSVFPMTKDASELLYELTDGGMDVNPESLDHFVTAYGGGLSKDVLDVINGVYLGAKRERSLCQIISH